MRKLESEVIKKMLHHIEMAQGLAQFLSPGNSKPKLVWKLESAHRLASEYESVNHLMKTTWAKGPEGKTT